MKHSEYNANKNGFTFAPAIEPANKAVKPSLASRVKLSTVFKLDFGAMVLLAVLSNLQVI